MIVSCLSKYKNVLKCLLVSVLSKYKNVLNKLIYANFVADLW